jgi:hypothetical protein
MAGFIVQGMFYMEATFICLPVCGLVSITSPFVGFSLNSGL